MPSVADPYHFDTDPDPGPEKFGTGSYPARTWIRIRIVFAWIRIQEKKDSVPGKSLKRSFPMHCVFILLNHHFFCS